MLYSRLVSLFDQPHPDSYNIRWNSSPKFGLTFGVPRCDGKLWWPLGRVPTVGEHRLTYYVTWSWICIWRWFKSDSNAKSACNASALSVVTGLRGVCRDTQVFVLLPCCRAALSEFQSSTDELVLSSIFAFWAGVCLSGLFGETSHSYGASQAAALGGVAWVKGGRVPSLLTRHIWVFDETSYRVNGFFFFSIALKLFLGTFQTSMSEKQQ